MWDIWYISLSLCDCGLWKEPFFYFHSHSSELEMESYCFTLMTMSSDERYCQHFSGHLTLSLSHAVHLICPLAHTLRHTRTYIHIQYKSFVILRLRLKRKTHPAFRVLNAFYFQTNFNLRFKRKRDVRLTCKRV